MLLAGTQWEGHCSRGSREASTALWASRLAWAADGLFPLPHPHLLLPWLCRQTGVARVWWAGDPSPRASPTLKGCPPWETFTCHLLVVGCCLHVQLFACSMPSMRLILKVYFYSDIALWPPKRKLFKKKTIIPDSVSLMYPYLILWIFYMYVRMCLCIDVCILMCVCIVIYFPNIPVSSSSGYVCLYI